MFKPLLNLLAFVLLAVSAAFAASGTRSTPAVNLPLSFEVNHGQTAPQVKYLARSREGVLFFTDQGVTAAVPRSGAFRMLFENAATPAIAPEQKMIARSNYLARRDGTSIINVENYGAVRYSGLYPGIDVRFYGQGRHLEHDFVIAPGADPSRIVLRFEGLDHLTLSSTGEAELVLGKLRLKETQPLAWQTVNGAKQVVAARWTMRGPDRLGIELGAYDRSLPLTVDPVLVYATHIGGSNATDDNGDVFPADTFVGFIGLDSHRNVYIAGSTDAVDYPTTAGAFDRTVNQQPEFHVGSFSEGGFVSKFDPTGKVLIYSTYLRQEVDAMTVSAEGHVYTSMGADRQDLEPSPGFDQGIFIDKLSLDGSHLVFTTLFAENSNTTTCGTFENTAAHALIADTVGHLWVAGFTAGPCFPVTSGAFQTKLPNTEGSGFVTKFDTTKAPSSSIVYSTFLGDTGSSSTVSAIAIDSSGNAYLAGGTQGTTFPHSVGFGTGNDSVFVAKLNPTGTGLVFGTLLHGAAAATGLGIDSSHNVYVTGQAEQTFRTSTGAFRTTFSGATSCKDFNGNTIPCKEGFITKLSSGGGTLIYSTFFGGSGDDFMGGLFLNSARMAFVAGTTKSTDFPTTANAFKKTLPAGASNAFVAALQPDGKSLVYSTLLGGSKSTTGGPIFVDPAWNAWVGGNTQDSDFPVTPDAFQPGKKGNSDGFFAKVVIAADLGATLAENTTLVARNSTVTYTERVNNFGPDGSDAVVLTDTVPSGFSFAGIVSSTASSCSVPALGATSGSVVCHKTRLENGQSFTVVLKLKAIAASGSHLTNTIKVSARTQDLKPANNTAHVVVVVQ